MTTPIILDEPVVWPQKGRGGFYRNQHGEAVVAHPDGGKRALIYEGASSLLDFGKPYTGDPIHGERGSAVHTICDLEDTDGALEETLAHAEHCESIGIPQDLAAHIADEWLRVRAALGITTEYIEQTVVHDKWRVATNVDRIDVLPDGRHVCADIKSAANVVKAAYLLQLAVGASSVKYDPDSGERTPWPVTLDQTIGHIWHFPIGEAIKAHAEGRPLPTWTLVTVDLAHGFALGEALHALKTDTQHKDSFAAPTPPVVEQRAGGVERTANAKASPATLDEWRALAATWEPKKDQEWRQYLAVKGYTKDSTDAERLTAYKAFDAEYAFRSTQTTPQPRRNTKVTPPAVRSVKPDEGDAIPESSIALIGEAYKALRDDVRSWVTVNGAGVRLSPQHGGVASVRRFEIMRGLIAMARAGFDDDATLRAVCDLAIGEDTQMTFKVPDIVGSLTLDEARRFASICVDHIEHGAVSLTFRNDGRAVISRSAA